jgi:superfamily II DNA helicase RecQ
MSEFSRSIHQLGERLSFTSIRDIAIDGINRLPRYEQDKLHEELVRGTAVLDDEPHMNMYLRSFGLMHKAKIDEAFNNMLPYLDKLFSQYIEIYDWGCGQGIATICMLDFLRKHHIQPNFKRINLIEPSAVAVERAKDILSCYQECDNAEIRIVNKVFDDLQPDDINSFKCRKLHLFSNILDVAAFDLAAFTQLFQKTQKGGNYIICVGPLNKGYKRVDWFIEALNPEIRYATIDKQKGCWIEGKEWTISLRIVASKIESVDEIAAIKKRITDAQKHQQFYAGYITDAVSDVLHDSVFAEIAEELMASVSTFDVISNKALEHEGDINQIFAVLNNIISRGLPTRAPLLIEKLFAEKFNYSNLSADNPVEYHFEKTDLCSAEQIFEALHLIDPRFSLSNYNDRILESSFESEFIHEYLPKDNKTYLVQLLEPQRSLSSILDIPNKKFAKEQRVDFALEIPYTTESRSNHIGFVVEINGQQYHSSVVSRIKDARRDRLVKNQGWNTDSLTSISDDSFIGDWENDEKYSSYLSILKRNYKKKIEGDWADYLQFVLSPFAVARVEKVLVEAIITGALDLTAKSWNIAVVERDVPCAKMAIDDLTDLYDHLCVLKGTTERLPKINLTVISTDAFCHSPLHGNITPKLTQENNSNYDICIDISMLVRSKIDARNIVLKSDTYYVIRSSHYSQGVRTIYSANNIEYQPLVDKTSRGEYITIPKREEVLTYFLQNIFRKQHFREGQLPILSRALSNKTTIGLLPTGGGKSLTYQLAAMLQPGVTIIVDPLVSLMVDQYEGLVKQRIDVSACINSTQEREDKTFNLGRLQNGELQFMFLSPERFMMEDFREELLKMTRRNNVYFAYGVIDEVHTVSEWGHDFRPAYLQLGRNMTRFMETSSGRDISIIGLTATASFDVLADVERELTLGGQMSLDSDAIVRPEMSEREELTYRIVEVKADFSQFKLRNSSYVVSLNKWGLRDQISEAKRVELDQLLSQIPFDIEIINNSNKNSNLNISNYSPIDFYNANNMGIYENAGIVFCPVRTGLDGVNDRINPWHIKQGLSTYITSLSPKYVVGTFVGGDNPTGDMDAFKKNEQNIMVATKAFGMGIDKPNVRFTININHPSSIESYVQEAGRAGRDKKISISYLLYESTEYFELSVENIADALGMNNPYPWLNNYKDHYVLTTDFKGLCLQYNLTNAQAQQLEDSFAPFKQNVDKSIEMFFHSNSFRGSFKEKVILAELTYNILNVNNVPANNAAGVYGALSGLNNKDYSYVIVSWENQYQQNGQQYYNEIVREANNLARQFGWNQLPANPFARVNLYKINSFGELLQEISKITRDDNWRLYHSSPELWPLNKAFCKRRDKDDTDKAIYRMCCIGLVDDVTIDYVNHYYTLKVVKRPDGAYYDSLRSFFEKYYSADQSLHKVAEAMRHRGNTEPDKCLGYLADFVYENLEVKRRRAIEDMREACIEGIRNGDVWLKQFIHLYFNSKYARDKYEINGVSYSLKRDIKTNPSSALILKYIRVMDKDTSGTMNDNVKHLYGAVLIILRAQSKDDPVNAVLFLLRSYCLAFLGVGNNQTLIAEFKTGYYSEGFEKIIETDLKRRPLSLLGLIDIYNDKVLRNTQDSVVKEYVNDAKDMIKLQLANKEIENYTLLYTK